MCFAFTYGDEVGCIGHVGQEGVRSCRLRSVWRPILMRAQALTEHHSEICGMVLLPFLLVGDVVSPAFHALISVLCIPHFSFNVL